jgi:hypothetical protein
MCRQTSCKKCGRASWAGCGAHVEQVLGHVPKSERCQCALATAGAGAGAGAGSAKKGWFRR